MQFRWEAEDLTGIVLKLLPAYIDLVSLDGSHVSFSPTEITFQQLTTNLISFFIEKCTCSLLLIQDGRDFNDVSNYSAYWVTAKSLDQEIILNYKVIPEHLIQKHFF